MSDEEEVNISSEEEEEADTKTMLYINIGFILIVTISTPLLRRIPRSTGENPLFHLLYVIFAFSMVFLLPDIIQNEIFSPYGVLIIGTVMPVYESIHAVCTPGEKDDTEWLQFWVVNASVGYATEFMDSIVPMLPEKVGEIWYELEFFFTLWLLLPITNGSGMIYKYVTEPFLNPIIQKCKAQLEGWGGLIITVVNTSNLGIVWFCFLALPEEARRFVTVAVGTIYPILASTVAIATKSTGLDDTYWLTYWACYAIMFSCMDYLENFIGSIRGFYSLCLVITVYLYLPMFEGAKAVFRNILVPLSGQHEELLLHDAYVMRLEMEKKFPNVFRETVLPKVIDVFQKDKTD